MNAKDVMSNLNRHYVANGKIYIMHRNPRLCKRSNIRQNLGDIRRRCLLAEFLREITAQQQANVEEETSSQDRAIEDHDQVTLSDDLLFKILILLPAEFLFRSQFVCKKWFSLINNSIFIRCHVQQSETLLICQNLTLLEPGNSAAWRPVGPQGSTDKPKSYFHFLDLNHGGNNFMESSVLELANIRASYDGLILATIENSRSLILMNPVTRKHIVLPLSMTHEFLFESFGIAFCNDTKTYKVVHLFRDELVGIGCEILNISTRKWTRIEPSSGIFVDIGQTAVSIRGSLNWMFSRRGCDNFVSMNVHDEKFIYKKLPISSLSKDRLLEIGGDLGFLSHAELDLLQVWILITDYGSRESWTKKYSINLSVCVVIPNPICSSRNGKGLVLEMKNELYAYNFETGEMKPIQSISDDDEGWFGRIFNEHIPHRNTLASWEDHLEVLLLC